jgi:hypothetical protein
MDLPRPQLGAAGPSAGPSATWPLQACTPLDAAGQAAAPPASIVVAQRPAEGAMQTVDMEAPALLQPSGSSKLEQPGGAARDAARQDGQPTHKQLLWRKAQARYKERKVGSTSWMA